MTDDARFSCHECGQAIDGDHDYLCTRCLDDLAYGVFPTDYTPEELAHAEAYDAQLANQPLIGNDDDLPF